MICIGRSKPAYLPHEVEWIECDLANLKDLEVAVKEASAKGSIDYVIFHLAREEKYRVAGSVPCRACLACNTTTKILER